MLGADRRRITIGRYPVVALADARKEAKHLLAEETLGRFRPSRSAFEDAKRDFLAECAKKNRPRTIKDYRRLLDTRFPFGRKSVTDIAPREIVRILNSLNETPSEKHHAYVVARAFFRWCVRQNLLERSPLEKVSVPARPIARERVLSRDEIRRLLLALRTEETTFKRICRLLLYTGQRRGEIARLEWEWIDGDTITIPAGVTKNKRTHSFPFGKSVAGILDAIPRLKDCPYVFPAARRVSDGTTVFNGWSRPKVALDEESGVTDWTLHDLRRTLSSGMAALSVPQVVVEKLLNHVSGGTQSPIAQVYNRHAYLAEMRDAVLRWETYLDNLTSPEG